MAYSNNIRAHLEELERRDLLVRVQEPVNKDTELHPLVRLQFRGLPQDERKGFLFENVTDSRNRKFDVPVAVGVAAGSHRIYAAGMRVESDAEVRALWARAITHPIEPELVSSAPAQEIVWTGDDLIGEGKGLDALPIPVSTPGFDVAPFITAGHWITKDIDTGIRNVGHYRGHLKGPDRTGVVVLPTQHIGIHWEKCRAKGIPLECAVVVGVPPVVSYGATAKVPYGVDELAIAGGMAGEAIPIVKCKTIDVEVPAEAEFIIEGRIQTGYREFEGPFGEYAGYMAEGMMSPVFEVSAITMRRNPVWVSYLSQYPPSESSLIRSIPLEETYTNFLRNLCSNPAVKQVVFPEYAAATEMAVVVVTPSHPTQVWKALYGATTLEAIFGRIVVAVDEDIDPHNPEALWWAISTRTMPHRDFKTIRGKTTICPYAVGPDLMVYKETKGFIDNEGTSAVMIDATRKWPYPPLSLPPREIMDRAVTLWNQLGLAELKLRSPWFGTSTGSSWPDYLAEAAMRAVKGDYAQTAEQWKGLREETS